MLKAKAIVVSLLAVYLAAVSIACADDGGSTSEDDPSADGGKTSNGDTSLGSSTPTDKSQGTTQPDGVVPTPDAGAEFVDPEDQDAGDVPSISLAVGDPISGVGSILGLGNNFVNGECTVGALGVDSKGKKVALTAGHCADVADAVIVKYGLKEQAQGKKSVKIGRARVFVKTIPAKDTFNKSNVTDALAIELDYWVDIVPSKLTVRAPQANEKVYRKGNGFTSPATSPGTVGLVTNNDFGSAMADGASAGDSGGPVLTADDKYLLGLVSRPFKDSSDKTIMATRVDAVISELNKLGGLGAGFILK